MSQKKLIKQQNTQQISAGPVTIPTQPKQKHKRNNNNKKLARTIKIGTYNFWQKHSNNKLGVVIEQKKINKATKHTTNWHWNRNDINTA